MTELEEKTMRLNDMRRRILNNEEVDPAEYAELLAKMRHAREAEILAGKKKPRKKKAAPEQES